MSTVGIHSTEMGGNNRTPKDYRLVSLLSFLLKTMERLIDFYVRSFFTQQKLLPGATRLSKR